MKEALVNFLKQTVVVDTRSAWVYIGILEEVMEGCIVLSEVDVHDGSETHTPKERYVMDSKTSGVKANRNSVFINLEWVVSFSPLEDIKDFGTY